MTAARYNPEVSLMGQRDFSRLPSIPQARLPAVYEKAKLAVSECARIDECKDWADKMAALGSYAKQSHDDSLRQMAERIQARAIRRCGELMNELAPNGAGRPKSSPKNGKVPLTNLSKHDAAKQAGLSTHQKRTALRVANVPQGEFEAAVESDNPPSVSELAERGKQSTQPVVDHLGGIDPEDFKIATRVQGSLRRLSEFLAETDPEIVVRGSRAREKPEILGQAEGIVRWLTELIPILRNGRR